MAATAETLVLPPATLAVGVTDDARRLDGWLLALQARGIPARLEPAEGAVALHVLPMDVDAARVELDAMDVEELERHRAASTVVPEHHTFHSRFAPLGGLLFAVILLGMYVVTGPAASHAAWFAHGASDAARVVHGEWWRTITALTLHADSNHVLSNIALGGVVVAMVMRRTGVGLGAALVVLAGALGNAVNAWGYGLHHSSIGFSTAVFGAIGILGGLTFAGGTRRGRPAWTAIAGSIGLLAMLGASERTDMLAHLFGTLAGLALGLAIGHVRWRPRAVGQTLIGLATLGVVAGAWGLAFA